MDTSPILALFSDSRWKQSVRRNMLRWFDRHARDLPWRHTHAAYPVWLSEIMLQQTQVATVVEYYGRFLERFPTIDTLARADENEVLRYWEGLGYYRRAQQLHRAARRIVAEHGGTFPRSMDEVRALPGIGRYTAGAILSIAFGQRQPVVEANTTRLYCRLLALAGEPQRAATQRLLWSFAEQILPRKRPGDFNQAAMELGSIICTPRQPQCSCCPVANQCQARVQGVQTQIPAPRKRVESTTVEEAAVAIRHKELVLLRRIPPGRRWAGLWDFPRFTLEPPATRQLPERLAAEVKNITGLTIAMPRHFATLRHTVTRFQITLYCYEATCRRLAHTNNGWRWIPMEELSNYPLSVTGRKISHWLIGKPFG